MTIKQKVFIVWTVPCISFAIYIGASAQQQNFGGNGSGSGVIYSVGGGTAQAQTVAPTLTPISNSTLTAGTEICWTPAAANSGPGPTLAGSGTSTFSAKTITKYGTVPLIANDINPSTKNPISCAIYDGTEFQLQNPLAGVITQMSITPVGASAQALNLFVSNGCDGISACTGNAIIFQAPASLTGGSATYSWDPSANMTVPGSFFSPVGAAGTPPYSFTGHTNSGLYWNGNGYTTLTQNGADSLGVTLTQVEAINGAVYLWAPTIGGSPDSGMSRDAAGIIDFGNGSPANSSAFIRSGNTVTLTSNFTTASTSLVTITGFSWTFPATNHNYSFTCRLSYSQATAAATNAFGVQAATTAPTNLYAAMHVDTSLANAGVNATLPTLTTTTATNIGTFLPGAFGAIGTVADIFTAELWGTLQQGAGATTLNIMALSGSAADSLTIYQGSSCSLLP